MIDDVDGAALTQPARMRTLRRRHEAEDADLKAFGGGGAMTISTFGRGAARRLTAAVALLAMFASATPVRAQLDTPTSPLPVFEMADRQDWVLRTTLADGTVVTGRVRDIDGTSVRLEGGRFDVADVVTIDRGERSGRGGAAGLGVGAAIVGFGVLLVAALGLTPDDDDGLFLALVGLVGVAAVIGGLLTAAMNPSETEWLPVWPAGDD